MRKIKNVIKVNDIEYYRLYDENGKLTNDNAMAGFSEEDQKEAIEELQQFDLMEVIENKGTKYYRMLEPKSKSVPFNILNT